MSPPTPSKTARPFCVPGHVFKFLTVPSPRCHSPRHSLADYRIQKDWKRLMHRCPSIGLLCIPWRGGWAPNPKGIGAWYPMGNKRGEMALNDMAIVLGRMVRTPQYLESHKRWEIMEPKLFNLFGFPLFFQKNAHKHRDCLWHQSHRLRLCLMREELVSVSMSLPISSHSCIQAGDLIFLPSAKSRWQFIVESLCISNYFINQTPLDSTRARECWSARCCLGPFPVCALGLWGPRCHIVLRDCSVGTGHVPKSSSILFCGGSASGSDI